MYALKAEDLTHLGGPMGTEYTEDLWTKFFNKMDNAKAYALKHYRKESKDKKAILEWVKDGKFGDIRTDDLGFVMYYIVKVKTED